MRSYFGRFKDNNVDKRLLNESQVYTSIYIIRIYDNLGYVSDKFGRRKTLFPLVIGLGTCGSLSAFVPSIEFFIIARFLLLLDTSTTIYFTSIQSDLNWQVFPRIFHNWSFHHRLRVDYGDYWGEVANYYWNRLRIRLGLRLDFFGLIGIRNHGLAANANNY